MAHRDVALQQHYNQSYSINLGFARLPHASYNLDKIVTRQKTLSKIGRVLIMTHTQLKKLIQIW